MRKIIIEFIRRGLIACGFGPLVLASIYLILQKQGEIQSLTINEMCMGIFSISALAFVVGGMNAVYQIERLPLMVAILMHGGVLYISYLVTYLVNGWLEGGLTPILVFTIIFALSYLAIWGVIYFVTKNRAERLNELLIMKQQEEK